MMSKLLEMAKGEGIDILYWDFREPLQGVYCTGTNIPSTIALSNRLIASSCNDICSILAELLGAHFSFARAGEEVIYPCYNGKKERTTLLAKEWAANYLISQDDLHKALAQGNTDVNKLVNYFGFSEELIKIRLKIAIINKELAVS
ncbi:ImmA/IrrE family metallo-endopeptidase [Desulforamulus ruminis]|uniref:IrrE N-terminal-like domain-containing protein n=1 Tax=Desulforamulus ruminis (strain ATCC 23193 / DSM 2154 / NCIMB 8452 / DL) TaxID=696281 RepID=F6DQ57_DESRL|nr:ImmA/IrrE family metallo-endopeptidase [Desulforamulus ruminis]AEG62001.1 protein of unknown function DUF955 [Desulforamulus ruminis DSM 2154]